MPLNNISISQTFHLGSTNFFKLENGGTISENETREELVQDAIIFFDLTLKKYFPNADDTAIMTAVIIEKPMQEPEPTGYGETLSEQIMSCKDLTTLNSYRLLVVGKQEQKTFSEKLKELSK